jgi:hypothetical protein
MKDTRKIAMLVLMFLILLAANALAQDIVEKSLPVIRAEFLEPVRLISYDLSDSQGGTIGLELVYRSLDQQVFKFQPVQGLANGDYTFNIEAQSIDTGMSKITTRDFTVKSRLEITLEQPRFGYTATSIVNVIIRTTKPAECRWEKDVDAAYSEMKPFSSVQDSGTKHTKQGFEATREGNVFYVKCRDTETGTIVSEAYTIKFYDETKPSINVRADPGLISEQPFETEISVTSDDLVVCKFDNESVNYYNMDYVFPGFDEADESAHDTEHSFTQRLSSQSANYTYYVACRNLAGLTSDIVPVSFRVDPGALIISIIQPRFGYTNESPVAVVIGTNRPVECKWQHIDDDYLYMNPFDYTQQGGTRHIRQGFKVAVSGSDFYVKCDNAERNEIVSKHFIIFLDATPPNIRADAYPDLITDRPFETEIIVTSDDLVVCRYDTNTVIYDDMLYTFPGFDEADESAYKEEHREKITDLTDNTEYTYYVACKSLAGLKSDTVQVDFEVDSEAPGQISVISPSDGLITSNPEITLEIVTNRRSVCSYGPDQSAELLSGSFGVRGYRHMSDEISFDDGKYTYYFKCEYTTPEEGVLTMTQSTSFTVDTTPPSKPFVNDTSPFKGLPEYSLYLDKLFGRWKSEDNLSGIKGYEYTILEFENDTIITTGYTNEEYKWVYNLELVDKTKYYFRVIAENNAGLWSANGTSDGVTVDTNKTPRNETPSCDDGLKNQNETDIDCGGPCDECPEGKECEEDADCKSGLECEDGVCSEADTCSNNQLDPGETDVDCGGICAFKGKLCAIGEVCEYNVDCESLSCVDGRCAEEPTEVCTTGQITNCQVGECDGTKTCQDGTWGPCVKIDPECGVEEKKGLPNIIKLLLWMLVLGLLAVIGYYGLKYYQKKKKPKLPPKRKPKPGFVPRPGRYPPMRPKKLTEEERKRMLALRKKVRRKRRGLKEAERKELFKAFEVPKKEGVPAAPKKKGEKPVPGKKEEKPSLPKLPPLKGEKEKKKPAPKKKAALKKKPKKPRTAKEEDIFKKLRKETRELKKVTKKPTKK